MMLQLVFKIIMLGLFISTSLHAFTSYKLNKEVNTIHFYIIGFSLASFLMYIFN